MDIEQAKSVLSKRANLAIIGSWGVIIASAAMMLIELSELFGLIDLNFPSEAIANFYAAVGIFYTVAFVLSIIFVAMWIHRAHKNLQETGDDRLEFTPGWAVGWYFIPIANLFKPFQAMRELWHASEGSDSSYSSEAPSHLTAWWATWIIGNIISNVSQRLYNTADPGAMTIAALTGAVSSVLIIACAWLLIGVIRQITENQQHGLRLADVFA